MVSDTYAVCHGRVADVVDGTTLVVHLDATCSDFDVSWHGRVRVRLARVLAPLDAQFANESKAALTARLLGKVVTVLPSDFQDGDGLVALVHAPSDQSTTQLDAGLASLRRAGPHEVDWYTECLYKRAEDRARAAKKGMWADAHPSLVSAPRCRAPR